jgi:ABC-type nickel/cobalt efflux system permease component RcnA
MRAVGRWSALGIFTALAVAVAATQASDGMSAWTVMVAGAARLQQDFHLELIDALRTLSQSASIGAAWALIVASFLYGIFHAAGPGHGKAGSRPSTWCNFVDGLRA